MTRAIFRADASRTIGTGHVMRCLSLADELTSAGAHVQFVCRLHDGHLKSTIEGRGYRFRGLPVTEASDNDLAHSSWLGATNEMDAAQCIELMDGQAPDLVVVDHYALDHRWESEIARQTSARVVVIDDLADRRHDCAVLIDQTLGRSPSAYNGLVGEKTSLCVGAEYALLHSRFRHLRETASSNRFNSEPKQMLLTMGGVDQANLTARLVSALATVDEMAGWHLNVVLGGANPHRDAVEMALGRYPFSHEINVAVKDMASLIARSALAITAAGSTVWELLCLGVPPILVVSALNQEVIASNVVASGAGWQLSADRPEMEIIRAAVSLDEEAWRGYVSKAARQVDGKGAQRVVRTLEALS